MSKQRPPDQPPEAAASWPSADAAPGPPTARYPQGYSPQQHPPQQHPAQQHPPQQHPPQQHPPQQHPLQQHPASHAPPAHQAEWQAPPTSRGGHLPQAELDRTISPSDLGQRTISISSPLGHTQLLHPELAQGPDSGARLIASQASTQALHGAALHPEAPEWMRMGRLLTLQIEDAIARSQGDAAAQAAIERAWFAWQLGGYTTAQLRDVATNLMRAYTMAQQAPSEHRDAVVNDSAGVVYSTLPAAVRERCDRTRVLLALQLMMEYDDPRSARFEGLAVVLSWTEQARSLGKRALAVVFGER